MESYNEKLKRDVDNSFVYGKELLESEKHRLSSEVLKKLPEEKGIYAFYSKDNKIVFIGSAIGEKGLYQCISNNHLKKSCSKSVFKKQIIEDDTNTISDIKSQELINYIKNNFKISYIDMNNKDNSFIKLTEFLLIRCFNPKYNKEGKIKN